MDRLAIALEESGPDRTRLRLSGRLRQGWCARLAGGLAARGIDVVGGRAVARGTGLWEAEIELGRAPDDLPERADLAQLLTFDAPTGFRTPLEIDTFALVRSEHHGGSLRLEVGAPDRVGFLAALLRRLAYHALFPVELRLETVSGRVQDRLWLCGAGPVPPSERTERALRARLEALAKPDP